MNLEEDPLYPPPLWGLTKQVPVEHKEWGNQFIAHPYSAPKRLMSMYLDLKLVSGDQVLSNPKSYPDTCSGWTAWERPFFGDRGNSPIQTSREPTPDSEAPCIQRKTFNPWRLRMVNETLLQLGGGYKSGQCHRVHGSTPGEALCDFSSVFMLVS